jgi:hypothetical protein
VTVAVVTVAVVTVAVVTVAVVTGTKPGAEDTGTTAVEQRTEPA